MAATILVPLDGSDKDDRALAIAAAFARLADGTLHLIRVCEVPVGHPAADERAAGRADAPRPEEAAAERSIRAAAGSLADVAHRPVTWEVVPAPDVADALLYRAAELDVVLVVVATRAPRPVDRAVRGSVADRLVREGSRPVVLVPPGAEHAAGKRVELRRGLVPLDDSAAARDMVDHLLGLPRVGDLEWVLLQVVPPPHAGLVDALRGETRHAVAERAERRLEAVAERLRERGATVDVRVAEADDPAAVISGAVRQDLVDFIAISTRGAHGLERWVLGSVAESVVRTAEVPVLLRTPTR